MVRFFLQLAADQDGIRLKDGPIRSSRIIAEIPGKIILQTRIKGTCAQVGGELKAHLESLK